MNRFNKASVAVLFKKTGCKPCKVAQKNLREVLLEQEDLGKHIKVLDIEHHNALRGIYCLEAFPTLLLLDGHGQEIKRTVGGRNLTSELFKTVLTALHDNHSDELPL
jgi:hypothetical protein